MYSSEQYDDQTGALLHLKIRKQGLSPGVDCNGSGNQERSLRSIER